MNITEEEIRIIKDCLGTTKDYIDYPYTHNGTTRLRKANNRAIELVNNLSQHLVIKSFYCTDVNGRCDKQCADCNCIDKK